MPAPRKQEVRLVETLLHSEAEDASQLAESIITALDAHRADRVDWCVIVHDGRVARAYGAWPGRKSAEKDLARGRVPVLSSERAVVCPFIGVTRMMRAWERVDTPAPKVGKVETVSRRPTVSDTHVKNVDSIHVLEGDRWSKVYG